MLFSTVRRPRRDGYAEGWISDSGPRSVFGIPTLRELLPSAATELRRARRYERPLSVLAVAASDHDPRPLSKDATPAAAGNLAAAGIRWPYMAYMLLGSVLRGLIREWDLLAASPQHRDYILILPESTEEEARRTAGRIAHIVQSYASIGVHAGIAEFPRDGFTFDDLLARARDVCRRRTTLSPAPATPAGNGQGAHG